MGGPYIVKLFCVYSHVQVSWHHQAVLWEAHILWHCFVRVASHLYMCPGMCFYRLGWTIILDGAHTFFYWQNFTQKRNKKFKNFRVKWFRRGLVARSEKKRVNTARQRKRFQYVVINIEGWWNICTSYSQF